MFLLTKINTIIFWFEENSLLAPHLWTVTNLYCTPCKFSRCIISIQLNICLAFKYIGYYSSVELQDGEKDISSNFIYLITCTKVRDQIINWHPNHGCFIVDVSAWFLKKMLNMDCTARQLVVLSFCIFNLLQGTDILFNICIITVLFTGIAKLWQCSNK